MATFNPNLSNGTCYSSENTEASHNFIPCGNSALGNFMCCQAGDFCLSNDVCFNAATRNTYVAGCTDPNWVLVGCPFKSQWSDQQWVGLVQCNDKDANGQIGWAGCNEPKAYSTLAVGDTCSCTGQPILFRAGTSLTQIGSLPATVGGTVSWASGFTPTASTAVGPTPGSATATQTGVTTNTAAPAASGSTGLSGGQIAGAVVGSVLGAIAILLVVLFFLAQRRKRRRLAEAQNAAPVYPDQPMDQQYVAWDNNQGWQQQQPMMPQGEMVGTPSYSGYKSELAANDSVTAEALRTPSPHASQDSPHQFQNYSPDMHAGNGQWAYGQQGQYQGDRESTISDASAMGQQRYMSPQHTGSSENPSELQSGVTKPSKPMDPISELQG